MSDDLNGALNDLEEAENENDALRRALEPFAEIARRLGWDKYDEDDMRLGEHIIEAPAEDIGPGVAYCLMVSAFREAALMTAQEPAQSPVSREPTSGD